MKYSVILSALPLACLMACLQACSTDEDGGVAEEPAVQNHAIKFSVKERPLGGTPVQKGMRRSPETTLKNITAFSLSYVVNGSSSERVKVTKFVDGNTYTWKGDAAWPANYVNGTKADTKVAWYAHTVNGSHCEEQFVYDDGRPYLYFLMDEYAEETGDLLVAQTTKSYNECKDSEGNAQLALTFNHVCSAVQLYISKTASLDDYIVEVRKVVLHNVASRGTFYLDDNTWEPDYDDPDAKTYFTVKAYKGQEDSYLTVTKDTQVLGEEGDYLFVIPQTLTGWDKTGTPSDCYLEIDCKITTKDGQTVVHNGSAYISFSATLEQNYIHPFNIKIGTGLRDVNGNKIIQ